MDAPNYVQGLYTVAQRDAIFAKADKYPDAADGLQNQVPTIFPDGTVGWRQVPEGGDGTANANIAVVESTNKASKTYYPGDLLIYNGQLYVATVVISSGSFLFPDANILPTRADMQLLSINGKGENCLRNWYMYGGGSQQGGGQFPINQRGLTSYTAVGETIDGWFQTGGTTTVEDYDIRHTSLANASSDLYQVVDRPFIPGATSISFGVLSGIRFFSGSVNLGTLSEETVVYSGDDCQLLLAPVSGNRIKAIIRVYAGHNVIIIAAKIEIGPISTLSLRSSQISGVYRLADTSPDYGMELAKCQRYYEAGIEWQAIVDANGFYRNTIPYKVTKAKAAVPSVGGAVYWDGTVWADASGNVSIAALGNKPEYGCIIAVTGLPAGAIFDVQIAASAE